jgi:hypothetical protein
MQRLTSYGTVFICFILKHKGRYDPIKAMTQVREQDVNKNIVVKQQNKVR